MILAVWLGLWLGLARRGRGLAFGGTAAGLSVLGLSVLFTEGLNLAGSLHSSPILWGLAAVVALMWAARVPPGGRTSQEGLTCGRDKLEFPARHWVLWFGLLATVTGLQAFLPAPCTPDALDYHLTRAAFWRQQDSLAPFGSDDLRQLLLPPGAEEAVLQTMLVSGSDRWVAFPQWMAYLGCQGSAWMLTGAPGALLVASLPMALLQASSTQNDLVAAFLVVSCAAMGARRCWGWASLALALGLATKPTIWPLLALLFAEFCFRPNWLRPGIARILDRSGIRPQSGAAVAACGALAYPRPPLRALGGLLFLVALVNAGWILRNTAMNDDPLGLRTLSPHVRPPRPAPVSCFLRNAAVQLDAPLLRGPMERAVTLAHGWLGQDPSDPETTFDRQVWRLPGRPRREDAAGNPLHALYLVGALVMLRTGRQRRLLLIALLGFTALSAGLRFQPWVSRLQLPALVLACAAAGRRPNLPALAVMSAAALPLLLWNSQRPLLDSQPLQWGVGSASIFQGSREEQYFRLCLHLREDYGQALEWLRRERPARVGLASRMNLSYIFMAEYPAQYGSLLTTGPVSALEDPFFRPEVLLTWERRQDPPGWDLRGHWGDLRAYRSISSTSSSLRPVGSRASIQARQTGEKRPSRVSSSNF